MWHTGLRHADASKLLVQNIQAVNQAGLDPFHGWYLTVGLTKTSKASGVSRVLRLRDDGTDASPQACLRELKACLQCLSITLTTGLLFAAITTKGKHATLGPQATTYKTAEHYFNMVQTLAEIPLGITLHSFHGSKAAMDRDRGKTLATICEEMDWTMATLNEYLGGRRPVSMPILVE